MVKNDNFVKTDFRKYEISYNEGMLSNIYFLKLTQLEVLKIRHALLYIHMNSLALKITKFIKLVDNGKNETTDFQRILPRKTNGERIRKWQDLRSL